MLRSSNGGDVDSVDLEVLTSLRDWQSDMPCWLVTVAETFGSSPRPAGAMLALRADGLMVGSVSGGCVEDDLLLRAKAGRFATDRTEILSYGVTREEALRFSLPCGGTLRLVIEPVCNARWVGNVLQAVNERRKIMRTLHLDTMRVKLSDDAEGFEFDGNTMKTLYGPRLRMLIIGANQTAAYLARMAQALDYQVHVCDPRSGMRNAWDVPGTNFTSEMPDDAVIALNADQGTAIIALTHDPKLDDMALIEALKSPAFYVGALGSKANNARRRERMALFDLSGDEIDRLHGPVGLPIGSRTPPEIAVSILAHLISVRAKARAEQFVLKEACS
jgi:xanthine dehydrogenase accessory factor